MQKVNLIARGIALAVALSGAIDAARAETVVGSTVESRVLLGFKIEDSIVTGMLPDGWFSVTLPKGPMTGSNLMVSFIDRHAAMDAEGRPVAPGIAASMVAFGRNPEVDGVRVFVTRVYEETPLENNYGNGHAADISRVASFEDAGGGDREMSENWTVVSDSGDKITLDLTTRIAGFGWSPGGESRPYSSVEPEFFRIYRYDQLVGLAMNTAMGRTLDGSIGFSATGPDLAGIFGDAAEPVAVVLIPTYVRTISLP